MPRRINFLHLGMGMMGVNHQKSNKKRNDLRFVAWFGTTPHVCSIIWSLLQKDWNKYVNNPQAVHLLWALRFMKGYSSWESHAAEVCKDSKTFRKWVWFYIKGIAILFPQIVSIYVIFKTLYTCIHC